MMGKSLERKLPKLNSRQLFVLDCVSKGRIKISIIYNKYLHRQTMEFFAIDSKVDGQIKSLRGRRLIRISQNPFEVVLTKQGEEELRKYKESANV
jgi:hypothetical protein